MLQRQVAQELGISEAAVWNWENNQKQPQVRFVPRIVAFLGYDPSEPAVDGFGWWLRATRRAAGLSRKKLARKLRVDESTVARWETGRGEPSGDLLAGLRDFLAGCQKGSRE